MKGIARKQSLFFHNINKAANLVLIKIGSAGKHFRSAIIIIKREIACAGEPSRHY
jgi:hypothetical protein